MARWTAVRDGDDDYRVDDLVTDDGTILGRIEAFWYASYPCAINSVTGNLERGGAYRDEVEARLWVERVAGLHPSKPGDERPPFYYQSKDGSS